MFVETKSSCGSSITVTLPSATIRISPARADPDSPRRLDEEATFTLVDGQVTREMDIHAQARMIGVAVGSGRDVRTLDDHAASPHERRPAWLTSRDDIRNIHHVDVAKLLERVDIDFGHLRLTVERHLTL